MVGEAYYKCPVNVLPAWRRLDLRGTRRACVRKILSPHFHVVRAYVGHALFTPSSDNLKFSHPIPLESCLFQTVESFASSTTASTPRLPVPVPSYTSGLDK